MPLLKTNCESINIRATIEDVFLNIEVKSNEIGNNNDSLMKFFYIINNDFMKNIGNLDFDSFLNMVSSKTELHLGNDDFIASVISRIIEKFNSYKDSIENEIEK